MVGIIIIPTVLLILFFLLPFLDRVLSGVPGDVLFRSALFSLSWWARFG